MATLSIGYRIRSSPIFSLEMRAGQCFNFANARLRAHFSTPPQQAVFWLFQYPAEGGWALDFSRAGHASSFREGSLGRTEHAPTASIIRPPEGRLPRIQVYSQRGFALADKLTENLLD